MNIWQITAGRPGSYYTDIFKKYDIMCLGPGDPGDICENKRDYSDYRLHREILSGIKQFANPAVVRAGDIILAREDYKIVAIGKVANDEYHWNHCLDDVYGCDIQHSRRVLWQNHLESELREMQSKLDDLFSDQQEIPIFGRVKDHDIVSELFPLTAKFKDRSLLKELSDIPKPLSVTCIRDQLRAEGLHPSDVVSLINVIEDTKRIARWYKENGESSFRPSKHEIISHITVPLMKALGWPIQMLGAEWGRVDLAGFRVAPSTRESCIFVCEAKTLSSTMGSVYKETRQHVQELGLESVKKILITDGPRIMVYEKSNGAWSSVPSGYVNLTRLRRSNLLPSNTDGIKTIMSLTLERMKE